jgi:hypothetical protein
VKTRERERKGEGVERRLGFPAALTLLSRIESGRIGPSCRRPRRCLVKPDPSFSPLPLSLSAATARPAGRVVTVGGRA